MKECFYRASAKILAINTDGQVLAVNESGKLFDLPGGGIEHGESAFEALKRELLEELGPGASTQILRKIDHQNSQIMIETAYLPDKAGWLLVIAAVVDISDAAPLQGSTSSVRWMDPSYFYVHDDPRIELVGRLLTRIIELPIRSSID